MNQAPEDWVSFIRSAQPVIAGSVVRTLRRWSRPTPDEIDRLTEEVFQKLYTQLPTIQENGPAWLRAFASAAALDFLRSQIAQNRAQEQTERTLLLGSVARSLATSDDRERWVFWLYYRHGLTPQAITGIAALKLTVEAVDETIDRLAQITEAEDHADSLRADDPGPAEPSCLAPADIAHIVAATDLSGLEELFDHVADCDRCGSLLHDALPGRDPADLDALRTGTQEWQSELAARWSRETHTGWLAAAVSFAKRLAQPAPARRVVRVQAAAISGSAEPPRDPPAPPARREPNSLPAPPAETEPESP